MTKGDTMSLDNRAYSLGFQKVWDSFNLLVASRDYGNVIPIECVYNLFPHFRLPPIKRMKRMTYWGFGGRKA